MRKFTVQFRHSGAPTLTGMNVNAETVFDAVEQTKTIIERDGTMLPCDELIVKLMKEDATNKESRAFTAEERRKMSGR